MSGEEGRGAVFTVKLPLGRDHLTDEEIVASEVKSANVSEIAFQTGFSSPDYFRSCLKKQFGYSPSDYRGRANR